jgi:hypothetical protein
MLHGVLCLGSGEHFTKVDTLRAEVANKTGVPVGSIDISVRAGDCCCRHAGCAIHRA